MKKVFVTMCMMLIGMAAFAGNPLKVTSGDKKFFKTAEGGALLEINYDGASFDGKMPLTDKYSDIPGKCKISYNGFVEDFSRNSKNVQIVKNASEAKYKISVKVTKVDEFINPMGWVVGPCIRVWGTLTITDIKGGAPLLVVDIDEIDGGSATSTDGAFEDTFNELGKRIAKLK